MGFFGFIGKAIIGKLVLEEALNSFERTSILNDVDDEKKKLDRKYSPIFKKRIEESRKLLKEIDAFWKKQPKIELEMESLRIDIKKETKYSEDRPPQGIIDIRNKWKNRNLNSNNS